MLQERLSLSFYKFLSNILTSFRMVHRLDKDTSGAMIVARSKDAATWISQAFVEHSKKGKDPSYKGIPGDYLCNN